MRSAFCMMGIAIAALPLMDKGVYSQNNTYFHSGKTGGGTTLPAGGLSDFFLNSF
jgi:hypothetical protein